MQAPSQEGLKNLNRWAENSCMQQTSERPNKSSFNFAAFQNFKLQIMAQTQLKHFFISLQKKGSTPYPQIMCSHKCNVPAVMEQGFGWHNVQQQQHPFLPLLCHHHSPISDLIGKVANIKSLV